MESSSMEQEFKAREYQVELLEIALKSNTIVFMPTGSGKTFIAAMLIKHMAKDVEKNYSKGGKRTFFLVNTVALVSQQAESISRTLPLKISTYSGDMGVDYWDHTKWLGELEENQVLVMTAQIFLNLLLHDYVKFDNVNLLIMDECHHTMHNHAMNQIMDLYRKLYNDESGNKENRPRILGLTATLLNANCKIQRIETEIKTLECNMDSKVITASDEEMVKKYSTNPNEEVRYYRESLTTPFGKDLLDECLKSLYKVLEHIYVEDIPIDNPVEGAELVAEFKKPITKRLKNMLVDIKKLHDDLGLYASAEGALTVIVRLERLKLTAADSVISTLLEIIITKLHQFRKKAFHYMKGFSEADMPLIFSTMKLKTLFEIFRDFPDRNVAIVFVERRITAKVLFHIFQKLSVTNPKYSKVSADFIVGFNSNPYNDTREILYMKKSNLATLRKFNKIETNVLFASNVIEEGIDIRLCNYVIKFDLPQTFRSYIQSKGRARNSQSTFILIMPEGDSQAANTYNLFKQMEDYMKKNLGGGRALSYLQDIDGDDDCFDDLPPYYVDGPRSAKVTALSAICLINRYCLSLPQDQFCVLTTSWWVRPVQVNGQITKYEGILRLPINCPIKDDITGPLCDSKMKAKRAVALETCKRLHQMGELDQNLLPCGRNSELLNDAKLFPHWDASEGRAGSKKIRRVYNKHYSIWERNCRPQPEINLYIHFIRVIPNYEKPENSRLAAFYDVLNSKRNFSIITSTPWPKVCSFSMFMNVGEVNIEVLENVKTVRLTKEKINSLFTFHCLIFTDILPNTKKFLMRDYENAENSFFVIPTIEDENGVINIDWETVTNHQELPAIKPLDSEVRKNIVVNDETYLGKVVVPWYRCEGFKLRYIVSQVNTDENPESPFPSANYESYAHYFEQRYSQRLLNPNQPLIEVRAISSKMNCLLPRGKRHRSSRRKRQDEDDFEETLIPELCCLFEFPAVYFLKATLLPSVLHRIHYLLISEELRRNIAKETRLGFINVPSGFCEEPLRVDHTTLQHEDQSKAHSTIEVSDLLTSNMNALKERIFPWKEEDEPYDIERLLPNVDMLAIKHYQKFMSESVGLKTVKHSSRYGYEESSIMETLPKAPLSLLNKGIKSNIGPQQSAILQALTSVSANDIINYERLETLGDSFLKYVVSLSLFINYFDKDEGKLTEVKAKLIGNKNFFFVGRNINLGSILKVHDFSPSDWDIPCFGLSKDLQNLVKQFNISPAVMYQISLSTFERDTGILKEETRQQIHELLSNSQDTNESSHTSWSIVGQQEVPDKTIADAIEALIGVYLESCGIEGGVRLCNWLGILAPELADLKNLLLTPAPSARLNPNGRVDFFLVEPDRIERKLHYKFKDRSFLLQALTHSSYQNNVTDCYQRLEFLGDAILDFLITVHIYENCGNLSPGELTDLRSALVNNITFACLAVRNGFHKHINARASKLNDIIERFVKHQESRDHKTGAEILFLIEEQSAQVAESVDVPKILGDVFESLAAAIYLDSGKNLQQVWNVYYHLMKREIDEFSRNVPKNHIRLLYEKFPSPPPKFGSASVLEDDGRVITPLEVIHNSKSHLFHGLGDNKYHAKLAAAKIALRFFHEKYQDVIG